MISNSDRLGYYRVGFKKFYNKTQALLEHKRTGFVIEWNFNNSVYSKFDWTMPIEESLNSLYHRRAQQLRNSYDHLILYFSGGADSANILNSFLENNIFLDEIVMQLPEPVRQTFNPNDTSNGNFYSELEYSAVPLLNRFRNKLNPNTIIRYQDFSKPTLEVLKKDNWIEDYPLCTNITISGISRQVSQNKETHLLRLFDKGKTIAQILGIDKPLVYFDGLDYYSFFSDTSTYHYVSPIDFNQTGFSGKHFRTEFFYWTPDMPEIVIKQAQEIKKKCEEDMLVKYMFSQTFSKHISEFRTVMHPIIYPLDLTIDFQTDKPTTNIIRPMDDWFWDTATETVKRNYLEVINYFKENIDPAFGIKEDITNGLAAHNSVFYKL